MDALINRLDTMNRVSDQSAEVLKQVKVFRAKVSHYRVHTFEESVIFVLDVERALAGLHDDDQQVIARVVFQGHSHDSAARLLGWKRRTVTRSLCEALDRLSELMLARGLLRKM